MKRSVVLAALALGLTVAACEEPVDRSDEYAPLPEAAPAAEAAEDQAVDAAATEAPAAPPADAGQLPPANPSSEESVQPESETLFY